MAEGGSELRSSNRANKGTQPDRFGFPKSNLSMKKVTSNNIDLDRTLLATHPENQMERNRSDSISSSKSRTSIRSKSIISNRSSSSTVKKNKIVITAMESISQLEDEEEDLKRRSDLMQLDIKSAMDGIEAIKANQETNPSTEAETISAYNAQIKMLELELKGQSKEYEKFKINYQCRLKTIHRNKSILQMKAQLAQDELCLLDDEDSDSQKVTDDNEQVANVDPDETDKWVKNTVTDFHNTTGATAMENTDKELLETERLSSERIELENKFKAKIAQAETIMNNEKRAAMMRQAEAKAIKAEEDMKLLEAEEELTLKQWEKAQTAITAKKLKIQKDAQAAKDEIGASQRSTESRAPEQPFDTLDPPNNQTEAMMMKFFDMQIRMMDQGPVVPRTSTSTFLARQSHAKELPYFGGKPEEWPTFIAEFERSSTDCAFSNSENMSRLRKCLKGEAMKTVQCLMVSPENLTKVLKTLKDRFGQPEHIIEAMICKAKTVPTIKEEKLETLIEFGNAVQNVTSSIVALKSEQHLYNPQLLRELEAKLPVTMRMNWIRWIRADVDRFKNLLFFAEWLENETVIACQLCPPKTNKEEKSTTESSRKQRSGDTVLTTSGNTTKANPKNRDNSSKGTWKPREKKCAFCSNIGHRIGECKQFEKQDLNARWKVVKEKRLCFYCLIYGHDLKVCRSKKTCGIDACEKTHHRLLHQIATVSATEEDSDLIPPEDDAFAGNAQQVFNNNNLDSRINVQILPVRLQGPKGIVHTYAMLDGGANITLIQKDLANQLGLEGPIKALRFQGLHPIAEELQSRCVKLNIMPATGNEKFGMTNVRTIQHMPLPYQSIRRKTIAKWKHLEGLGIQAYGGAQPKILIGNDHLRIMVIREVREGPPNSPVGVRTNLGWTLLNPGNVPEKPHFSFFCQEKDELHQMVKKYFTTESFGVKVCKELPRSKEDKRAQTIMDSTMKRVGDGNRWETGLLWKTDDVQLPESKSMALNRLKSIERKIDRDEKFASQYLEKMQHYLDKGYALKLSKEQAKQEGPRTWYLPHFGTFKPSKPDKIRLVFDAAAKSHGVSLNDTLLKGADQVNPLPSVLYKFRQRAIGITGDIREMFHQVNIRTEDKSSLRFLWRGTDRKMEPDTYEMQVMMFGSACSPVCAQEAKNRNAKEHAKRFPEASNAIINKHFVDDYLDSFDTVEEASKITKDVIQMHLLGGFEIVNFISNSKEVMKSLPEEMRATKAKVIDPESKRMERVLGLNWDPDSDQFTFSTNFHRVPKEVITGERMPTKREALSLIMSIYDPLGFLAHFTIKAKILLQETWRSEVGWDDEIPSSTHEKWCKWIEELQTISTFKLTRCYDVGFSKSNSIQLHIFCDASQQAFSAVAYFRIITEKGIKTAFVSAKSRVAPLKTLCMPRMELQAAVLGTRLATSIKKQHDIQPTETHFWTDSEVAYCWVRSDGNKCPQFVSHRIGEIQESTDARDWHWLPTKENVADEATRDNKPTLWNPESRWLKGPDFLLQEEDKWPKKSTKEIFKEVDESQLEFKKQFVGAATIEENILDVNNYSSWRKLQRVTGWIFRFILNLKSKKLARNSSQTLLLSELKTADVWLWRLSQKESFKDDLIRLIQGSELSKNSRLLTLGPYLDKAGVIRLKGRLDAASSVPNDLKNPVILDPKHQVTKLIIQHYHEESGHHGQERVVNELRQFYYIISLRTAVKSAQHHCQHCKNMRALPVTPQMGLLPDCRLQSYVRPFTVTGLDYFGPMEVTVGRRHEKRYGALFTCMTSRAVHVEIAYSLTTDSCIMAIRRFASRRGNPQKIYSDNGTNFHGANNELKAALEDLDQVKLQDKMTSLGIEWHFIPPAAPHMGGSWERLVKSIKTALNATLKGRYPKDELLQTLMAEAEHVVNSRPLTHVSYDHNDQEALTPNHFLIGCSSNMQPPGTFEEGEICLRKQWRAAEALSNQFWRRWVKEYLPCLTRRTKWHKLTKPICIGDVCLIADNNLTRNFWPKGLVTSVYPGRDGQIRVVEIKTAAGNYYKRPVTKICVLDVRKYAENASTSSSGGSMSASNKV